MGLFETLYDDQFDTSEPAILLDEAFRKQFDQLHDFIVKRSHNGLKREHGRVTISAEGDHFKITISDPTGQCSFAMLCDSIEAGLRSMENHCASSAIHWYYWKGKTNGASTSKKTSTKRPTSSSTTGVTKRTKKKK